jgi:hypothetical protein
LTLAFFSRRRGAISGARGPGAAFALAFVIFLPNFLWQIRHHFVSLDFLESIHARDIRIGRTDTFVLDQFWIATNPGTWTIPEKSDPSSEKSGLDGVGTHQHTKPPSTTRSTPVQKDVAWLSQIRCYRPLQTEHVAGPHFGSSMSRT